MTSSEFSEAIRALQMNRRQAAGFLRVTKSAVSRWATGARPVPGPVAALLETALASHENHEEAPR